MRIHALEPKMYNRLRSRLRRIDATLPRRILVEKDAASDSLIILSNGREDDIVVSLVCHHLNGSKTVDIVKPHPTRYGAIEKLKVYAKEGYKTIALVLDQEDDDLSVLNKRVKEKLGEAGIDSAEERPLSGRVMSYSCSLGGHGFRLVVVVNGLDDVGGFSHKIEDHLVKLAGVAGQGDSKDVWNGLDGVKKMDVFRKIHGDGDVAREVFGQHFEGFGLLDC